VTFLSGFSTCFVMDIGASEVCVFVLIGLCDKSSPGNSVGGRCHRNHARFDEVGPLGRLCIQPSGDDIEYVTTIPQGDAAQLRKVLEDH
jgi:hypothetical protein